MEREYLICTTTVVDRLSVLGRSAPETDFSEVAQALACVLGTSLAGIIQEEDTG
jgi:hypothetical protein